MRTESNQPYLQELLTYNECADFLKCTPKWVMELVKRGEIKAFRRGKKFTRLPLQAVHNFLEKHATVEA